MTDAVILDALRTPIGRYGGVLAGVRPDDLAAHVVRAAVERNELEPDSIDEVYMGCANQAGEDNRNVARMAVLLAGLPVERPGRDGQPPLRLGPRRGDPGRPPGQGRRGRPRAGRRGRVDDARSARDAQARARLPARGGQDGRHHARLAAGQPEHEALDRVDGRDGRERRGALRGLAHRPGRVRARVPPARGRRRRGRPARRRDRARSTCPSPRASRSPCTPTRARAPTPAWSASPS